MRIVMRGVTAASDALPASSPGGAHAVVVKWSRPTRVEDHVSHGLRGGKGVREGNVLLALAERGVAAPTPLAFSDEEGDVLVTEEIPDLEPMPPADLAGPALVRAVANLIADAHDAGLRTRDLHAGNLALSRSTPLLVDLGSARVGASLSERERVRALARLQHGLLGGARRSQRLRALGAYLEAAGDEDPRTSARALADGIEERARVVRRRYRRGRDRRAKRSGKHFRQFTSGRIERGARCRDFTDETWEARADSWLHAPPTDAISLKAGGHVLRTSAGQAQVVLKYYDGAAKGRVPRALRAFRRAYALQNRGVPVPQPLLATTGNTAEGDASGVYAATWIDGQDLHAFSAGGRDGAYGLLPLREQRGFLARLGRMLRALHDAEVTHRDLKSPNLLAASTDGGLAPVIVDLDGARIRGRTVSWRRRARDLARLDASLDACASDRLRVLRAYWSVLPRPPLPKREFLGRIEGRVRQKRGPAGLPR